MKAVMSYVWNSHSPVCVCPWGSWQVAGVHSCGQQSPGEFISLAVEELDAVPETYSSSCVMWGMMWIVSFC